MQQGLKLVVNNMEFLRQLSPVRIGACIFCVDVEVKSCSSHWN